MFLLVLSCGAFVPARAQLQLIQPNGGELLSVRGEYLIKWGGVAPTDSVRLEYSTDNGKTWRFITNAAGLSYRWKPIPSTPSDSCLLRASRPKDITTEPTPVQIDAASVLPPLSGSMTSYTAYELSPDGARVLARVTYSHYSSAPPYSLQSTRLGTGVWDATTGALIYSLPYINYTSSSTAYYYGYGYGYGYGNMGSSGWSPDGKRFFNAINDSTVGIYEAATGMLIGSVSRARVGSAVQFLMNNLQWSADGTTFSAQYSNWYGTPTRLDSTVTQRITWDAGTLMQLSVVTESSTQCSNVNAGYWYGSLSSTSHDGKRYVKWCSDGKKTTMVICNAVDGTTLQTISVSSVFTINGWQMNYWSPNDSLVVVPGNPLLIVNTWTGQIVQSIPYSGALNGYWWDLSWSPDGTKLLMPEYTFDGTSEVSFARVIDVKTGAVVSTAERFGGISINYGYGYSSGTRQSQAWSPDGTRIVSYITDEPNKIGIWDARTGCLLQVITASRNLGIYTTNFQWSADGMHLLVGGYASNTAKTNTTTTIYTIPTGVCNQDQSDSVWSIRVMSNLVTPSAVSFPALLCDSVAVRSFAVQSTGSKAVYISDVQIVGANADEFVLLHRPPPLFAVAGVDSVTVQFAPKTTGAKTAQLKIFSDAGNGTIATIALSARKDSTRIALSTKAIAFVAREANTALSTTFTLTNLGTVAQTWHVPMVAGAFTVDRIEPNPTPVGGKSTFRVTFAGGAEGAMFAESLALNDSCGRTSTLALTAAVEIPPAVIVTDTTLAFGTLLCENSSVRTLTIRNTGGKPLTVSSITFGGANADEFSILSFQAPLVIKGRSEARFNVRFDATVNGDKAAQIVIRSDASNAQEMTVLLRGAKQRTRFELSSDSLMIKNVPIGGGGSQTMTLTNTGSVPLLWNIPALNAALHTATKPSEFQIQKIQPNPTLVGGASQVTISFAGGAAGETYRREIALTDTCGIQRVVIAQATVQPPLPVLSVADTIRYDTLLCETEQTVPVDISNSGGRALRIDDITIAGAHKNDFTFALLAFPLSLPKFTDAITLNLRFQPQDTGWREARLVIRSNASNALPDSTYSVVVRGRKNSIDFAVSKRQVTFTTVAENTPLRDTLTVTNTGTQPIRWIQAPFSIDDHFSIEHIEPQTTPRGASSTLVVRFTGGKAGLIAQQTYMLSAPECNRSETMSLSGVVEKQPRLAAVPDTALRLLCASEARVALRLENNGTDDVVFTKPATVVNDGASEFRITYQPTRIAVGKHDSVVVVAQPTATGVKTVRIHIESNAANVPVMEPVVQIRKDSSGVRVLQERLDMGSVGEYGELRRSTMLENTGTIEQRWTLPMRFGAFVVDSITPNPTPPKSQASVLVRFVGGSGGLYSEEAVFVDSCGRSTGSSTRLPLVARVVAGEFALPAMTYLAPGNETDVPILLRKRGGVATGTTTAFTVRAANATLLEVLSPQPVESHYEHPNGRLERVSRFIATITSAVEDEPILKLKLRGLWGNDTLTTLRIDSASVSGVVVKSAGSAVGNIQTIGLNHAGGGVQLFTMKPTVTLKLVAPNPTSDEAVAVLAVTQRTTVNVMLTDMYGRRTQVFTGVVDEGEHSVPLQTSGFSSGVYGVEVRSASGVQVFFLTILR